MNDIERRKSALEMAFNYTLANEIGCIACLLDAAKAFDTFLLSGDAIVQHLGDIDEDDDDPDDDTNGTVISFPKGKRH